MASAGTSQKRTAYVYGGAAFLIVVVGVKTYFRTKGYEFEWLGLLTLGALFLEFFLLLLYAVTIYQDAPTDDPKTSTDPAGDDISSGQIEKLTELQTSMVDAVQELKITSESMKLQAERLDQINQSLEQIADEKVKQKIKDELHTILSNVITP